MVVILLVLLVLFAPVRALAFPDNGVLDSFTGTDNTSLSTYNPNWEACVILGSMSTFLTIQDNAIAREGGGSESDACWSTVFNADQEAYMTITAAATVSYGAVYTRLQNIGANTTDGYEVSAVVTTDQVNIMRIDNGAEILLGDAISQTVSVGDSFGLATVGDQICAWFKAGAGSWTNIGCRTDTTYAAGGKIGLTAAYDGSTTVGAYDDFGGGNISGAPAGHVFWTDPSGTHNVTGDASFCTTIDSVNDDAASDPGTWGTIAAAVMCMKTAGDKVNIRYANGTLYSGSNHAINTQTTHVNGLVSGTAETPSYIQGVPGQARPNISVAGVATGWFNTYTGTTQRHYVTIKHVNVGGDSSVDTIVSFGGSYLRLEDSIIHDAANNGVKSLKSDANDHHRTILDTAIYNTGLDGSGACGVLPGDYTTYVNVQCHHSQGRGTVFTAGAIVSSHSVITDSYWHDITTGTDNACGGALFYGDDNLFARNVADMRTCTGSPNYGPVGIDGHYFRAYHNILLARTNGICDICIGDLATGGTWTNIDVANNILLGWTNAPVFKWVSGSSFTSTNNRTTGVMTDCTESETVWDQKTGSLCLDAGINLAGRDTRFDASFTGLAPDIGVKEAASENSAPGSPSNFEVQ